MIGFMYFSAWGKEIQPDRMCLKKRLLPKLPQVLFRTIDSDPLIRNAVTF
jgi:hypothetical protein